MQMAEKVNQHDTYEEQIPAVQKQGCKYDVRPGTYVFDLIPECARPSKETCVEGFRQAEARQIGESWMMSSK